MLDTNNSKDNISESDLFSAYATSIEHLPFVYILKNYNGNVIEANAAARNLFGYTIEEFRELKKENFLYFDEESYTTFMSNRDAYKEKSTKIWGIAKDKKKFSLLLSSYAVSLNSEKLVVCLVITDIEHEQKEKKLSRDIEILEETNRIAIVGSYEVDLLTGNITLSKVVKEIHDIPDTDCFKPEFNKGILYYKEGESRDKMSRLLSQAINQGTPFDTEVELVSAKGIEKWVRITGNTQFSNGVCIRLFGVMQNIQEQKTNQLKLIQERSLLRTLIDALPVAVYIKDNKARKLIANKTDVELMGLANEQEALGKTDIEIFNSELSFQTYQRDLQILQTGEPIVNTPEIVYDDISNEIHLLTSKYPIKNRQGEVDGLVGIATDVTAKRLIEQRLNLVDFSFKNASVAICLIKSDASFYDFNEATHISLGYTRNELINLGVPDIDVYYKFEEWSFHWQNLKNKGSLLFETKQIKKDGSIKDVEVKANFILFNGIELNFAFATDITEKNKIAKELQRSNERYEQAMVATSDAMWEVDFAKNELYLSANFKTLFGYDTVGLHDNDLNLWGKHVHPEDFPKVIAITDNVLSSLQATYTTEYRYQKANGDYIFIVDKVLVIRDNEGKALRLVGAMQDVTKKKQAEEAFKAISSLQKNILDSAEFSIISSNYDGVIMTFNPCAERLLGYHAAEIVGKLTTEIFHDKAEIIAEARKLSIELGKQINPDFEVFVAKAKLGLVTENEWIYVKKNGERFPVSLSVSALQNDLGEITGFLGIAKDITSEKAMRQQLANSYGMLEETIHELVQQKYALDQHSIVSITNTEGIIIYANDNFCNISQYSEDELVGNTNSINRSHIHDDDFFKQMIITITKGDVWKDEVCNKAKDGTLYWTDTTIVPYLDAKTDKPIRYISIESNITERKKVEQEKQHMLDELTHSNLELKQFSYITTHNLRSPLTNLMSICTLLKTDKIQDAFTLKLIEGFKKSTVHLNETLNDLINILIIKEKRNLPVTSLNLDSMLKRVKESINSTIEKSETVIESNFHLAPNINFNNAYLESIFLNLITNSIKYAHPDRKPIIQISTDKGKNGSVILLFSDNGLGMNMQKVKDKIFGLYQRFHTNDDSKGIGLYLIHSQITALSGKIEVESEVNVGTSYTITFK